VGQVVKEVFFKKFLLVIRVGLFFVHCDEIRAWFFFWGGWGVVVVFGDLRNLGFDDVVEVACTYL